MNSTDTDKKETAAYHLCIWLFYGIHFQLEVENAVKDWKDRGVTQ